MFDSIRSSLQGVKSSFVENMAQSFINQKIEKMGQVTDLKINADEKCISFTVDLKGESSPVRIENAYYKLTEKGEKVFIQFERFEASREWMNTAFEQFLKNRPFEVPSAVKMAL